MRSSRRLLARRRRGSMFPLGGEILSPLAQSWLYQEEGGGEWSPPDEPGLLLWLDGDEGVYSDAGVTLAADGDLAYQWNDRSGNGYHATQANSGSRGTFKSAICNGHSGVRFDSAGRGMVIDSGLTLTQPFTLLVAYQASGGRAVQSMLIANHWLIGPYNDFHRVHNGSSFITGPASDANIPVIATATQTGGSTTFRVNGSVVGSAGGASANPGNLGLSASGAFAEMLGGDLLTVLVYDHVLSAAELAAAEGYLNDYYAVF